ncbi:MAG: hypothetical protein AAF525_00340 [Pseudomonadota bacterium]
MLRLRGINKEALTDEAVEYFLKALPVHRDGKAWRRFPFYYTLLALTGLEHPLVSDEFRYIAGECEKKLARMKPSDELNQRRMAVLTTVLERI